MPKTKAGQSGEVRQMRRSSTDLIIAGVAGGLGSYFGVDPTLFRLAFVLITLFGGSGILVYLLLWLIIPGDNNKKSDTANYIRTNIDDVKQKTEYWIDGVKGHSPQTGVLSDVGWFIVAVGLLFLLSNLGLLRLFRWDIWWPLVIIAFGFYLLFRRGRRG